jgi:hypothetical protein
MKYFTPILILALCGSACAQSVDVTGLADVSALVARHDELLARVKGLETRPEQTGVLNPIRDLGCGTTNDLATAQANSVKLAKWFDEKFAGSGVCKFEWAGFFPISEPFGIATQGGRSLPGQFELESVGGWIDGYYPLTNKKVNQCASGLVYYGDKFAVRCAWPGNYIKCNILCGSEKRAKAAIAFDRLLVGFPNGRATVLLNATNFEAALYFTGNNNSDHVAVLYLQTRNCLKAFESDNPQCVGCTVTHLSFFGPNEQAGPIIDFKAGGQFSLLSGRICSDYGLTVFRAPDAPAHGSNAGRYDIHATIDSAVLRGVKEGRGYFRAVEVPTGADIALRFDSFLPFSKRDTTAPPNLDGSPVFKIAPADGGAVQDIQIDMPGVTGAVAEGGAK